MLRRLLVILNLFCFVCAQSAFALTSSEVKLYNDFFKESKLTQHPVALSELRSKFGNKLPEDLKIQMDYLIKENPELMVPKFEVQKIIVNGEEQLQFHVKLPETDLIFTTLKSPDAWVSIVGTQNGEEVNTRIADSDFPGFAKQLHETRKTEYKKKHLSLVTMPVQAFMQLSKAEKKEYLKHVRETMEAIDEVQNTISMQQSAANGKGAFEYFFKAALEGQAFADEAEAKEGKDCDIAGWDGQWETSHGSKRLYCTNNNESISAQAKCKSGHVDGTHCNPAIFGDHDYCIPRTAYATATKDCNEKIDGNYSVVDKYVGKTSANDKAALQAALDGMSAAAKNAFQQACGDGSKHDTQDQKAACAHLLNRCKELEDISCSNIGQHAKAKKAIAKASDAKVYADWEAQCSAPLPAVPEPAKPVAPPQSHESTPPICRNDNNPDCNGKMVMCFGVSEFRNCRDADCGGGKQDSYLDAISDGSLLCKTSAKDSGASTPTKHSRKSGGGGGINWPVLGALVAGTLILGDIVYVNSKPKSPQLYTNQCGTYVNGSFVNCPTNSSGTLQNNVPLIQGSH